MLNIQTLSKRFFAEVPSRPYHSTIIFKTDGLRLGPDIRLVTGHDVSRQESRVLALLAAAHNRWINPAVLHYFAFAKRFYDKGEVCTALIALAHSGLPTLPNQEPERGKCAWRLFAADAFLSEGISPQEFMNAWGYGDLGKYDPTQPRVPAGSSNGGQWEGEQSTGIDIDHDQIGKPNQLFTPINYVISEKIDQFFEENFGIASEIAKEYGVDVVVLLGITGLESDYGKRRVGANNIFGATPNGINGVNYTTIE